MKTDPGPTLLVIGICLMLGVLFVTHGLGSDRGYAMGICDGYALGADRDDCALFGSACVCGEEAVVVKRAGLWTKNAPPKEGDDAVPNSP